MKKTNGFTLLELTVTISIIGILIALAMPHLQQIVRNNRVRAITDNLQVSMILARTEALTSYRTVYLCPKKVSNNSCETITTLQDYKKGWLLFKDCNGNGLFDQINVCDNDQDGIKESDELFKVIQYDLEDVTIVTDANHQAKIGFNSTGRPILGEAVYTITAPSVNTRKINISRTGIISRVF